MMISPPGGEEDGDWRLARCARMGGWTLGTYGFLGVGALGGPIARHIQAVVPLRIYDVDPAATARFEGTAEVAQSPAALASEVDVLFNCLPSAAAHREALLGPDGVVHGSRVRYVITVGTTGPFLAREIADGLAAKGIEALSAPVTGGPHVARARALTTIASGSAPAFALVTPLIETYSSKIFFLGADAEHAQTMKLINNMVSATNLAIASEALVLGAKAGLDAGQMIEILNGGTGQNSATSSKIPDHILPGTFNYGGRLELVCKDLNEYLAKARSLAVARTLSEMVVSVYERAAELESKNADMTTVIRPLEREAGVEVRARH